MNRVDYFNWVRDIPYRIPISPNEQDYCCEGKHKILERLLKLCSLEVRPRICETRWSDFVLLPKEVLKISHLENITHVFLEVKIKGKWCAVDATLDKGLKKVYSINEWDGKTSTPLCVRSLKLYSPRESLELWNGSCDYTEDLASNLYFYKAINAWFENIRRNEKSNWFE